MGRTVHGRFRAVLLDLDGCLVDSNDAHARAWSDALARFGRSVHASRLRRHIGKRDRPRGAGRARRPKRKRD